MKNVKYGRLVNYTLIFVIDISVFFPTENEDFEPVLKKPVVSDKWEGEDEDDDVKVCFIACFFKFIW